MNLTFMFIVVLDCSVDELVNSCMLCGSFIVVFVLGRGHQVLFFFFVSQFSCLWKASFTVRVIERGSKKINTEFNFVDLVTISEMNFT